MNKQTNLPSETATDKNRLEETLQLQNQKLVYTTFLQREDARYHHSYDEELLQYEYVRDGDMRSVEESKRLFRTGIAGKLSNDPLTDKKYLFVASTTLATRFCIEGGLDPLEAYNMSDLFIQHLDSCHTVEEVNEHQTLMIIAFTQKMASLRNSDSSSSTPLPEQSQSGVTKPIMECIDYIYYHLHEKITLQALSDAVGLTPNYLAALFKKEKGMTVQTYIRSRRIEAAKNMLLYSDYSATEISAYLAFSSTSHFIRVFRDETGMTPRQYLQKNFRKHTKWSGSD